MSNRRTGRMPWRHLEAVERRSGNMCEGCHVRQATDVHHRKPLARGGMHNIANLVHLCGGEGGLSGGNHSGCHGLAHSGDAPDGWLISRFEKKPDIGVFFTDLNGTIWRFDDYGEKVRVPGGIPF